MTIKRSNSRTYLPTHSPTQLSTLATLNRAHSQPTILISSSVPSAKKRRASISFEQKKPLSTKASLKIDKTECLVKLLANKDKRGIKKLFGTQCSAIKYAIKFNLQKELASLLGLFKFSINRALNEENDTLLMYAAKKNNPAAVQALIENGAQINALNRKGEMAFNFAAAYSNDFDLLKLLENPDLSVKNYLAATSSAIQHQNYTIANYLTETSFFYKNFREEKFWEVVKTLGRYGAGEEAKMLMQKLKKQSPTFDYVDRYTEASEAYKFGRAAASRGNLEMLEAVIIDPTDASELSAPKKALQWLAIDAIFYNQAEALKFLLNFFKQERQSESQKKILKEFFKRLEEKEEKADQLTLTNYASALEVFAPDVSINVLKKLKKLPMDFLEKQEFPIGSRLLDFYLTVHSGSAIDEATLGLEKLRNLISDLLQQKKLRPAVQKIAHAKLFSANAIALGQAVRKMIARTGSEKPLSQTARLTIFSKTLSKNIDPVKVVSEKGRKSMKQKFTNTATQLSQQQSSDLLEALGQIQAQMKIPAGKKTNKEKK